MNHFTPERQALLILLRKSLWGESGSFPPGIDWETVAAIAKDHAVVSLAYDGAVAAAAAVPEALLENWKKTLLRGVLHNERLLIAQDALLARFEEAGIPAVVLKGSSVARYYPQPELRVLGDIDILVREADLEAVAGIMEAQGYIKRESEHGFHIGYARAGACVEIHYHVTDFPDSAGGQAAEKVTAHFLEDIHPGTVGNHTFPVLSESHQAISLLLHMIRHMFSTGIGLRQLCDWAVYVSSVDPALFVGETIPLLSQCGLLRYAEVATGACVEYLGLPDQHLSWCAGVEKDVCRAFAADVFRSGNMGAANTEAMGSLFTDREAMGRKQAPVQALAVGVNRLAYMHFPVMRKYRILLPLAWVYLPLRYFVRSLLGLRPKKSAVKVVVSAKKRRDLYEKLRMFEIDQKEIR